MTESLGGPAGERPSLSGSGHPELPSGACPTRMPVSCELIAVRRSDTLETGGVSRSVVLLLLEQLMLLKSSELRKEGDKELIDWRSSGGFGDEIRGKLYQLSLPTQGFCCSES